MHKYERYIIYPLLILALFYSFGNVETLTFADNILERIVTKEIAIINEKGQEVLNVSSNDAGGATLSMSDNEGNQGIMLSTNKNGLNIIGVNRPDEDVGLYMLATREESQIQMYGPRDTLFDSNGNVVDGSIKLGVNQNKASLDIKDMSSNSQTVSGISISSFKREATNTILLGGDQGEGGIGIASDGGSYVQFSIYNEYGEDLVSMGKTRNEEGGLWIYDDRGRNEKFYGSY